jgi:hypothetical protein
LRVDAIRSVLESAGVAVVDLDEKLGDTKNADLRTYDDRSRLVEVKSASGSAPERAYQDLVRHLREWPTLLGSVPVEGGALVLNPRQAVQGHDDSPRAELARAGAEQQALNGTTDEARGGQGSCPRSASTSRARMRRSVGTSTH